MVSLISNKAVTKVVVGTREHSIAITGLTVLFIGRIWKILGLQTTKEVEIFK